MPTPIWIPEINGRTTLREPKYYIFAEGEYFGGIHSLEFLENSQNNLINALGHLPHNHTPFPYTVGRIIISQWCFQKLCMLYDDHRPGIKGFTITISYQHHDAESLLFKPLQYCDGFLHHDLYKKEDRLEKLLLRDMSCTEIIGRIRADDLNRIRNQMLGPAARLEWVFDPLGMLANHQG